MATSLPDFPPFDTESEPTSLGIQWKKWVLRLENLFVALDIKDKARQKALLLHYGGANLSDIYYTLASEEDKEYLQVKAKLDAHFEPKVNVTFETYNFRQLAQEQDEPIDKFVTRLRETADRCDFHDKDREIKDQIVQKCFSERLRRKALREDLTLSNLLKAARAMEIADVQAKAMENPSVLKVSQQFKSSKERPGHLETSGKTEQDEQRESRKKECFNCGGMWPHPSGRKSCPAWGVDCRKCGKKNHYARKCRATKAVRKIGNLSESEEEDEYRVSAVKAKAKESHHWVTARIDEIPLQFQIDSGADVNIIDEHSFAKLKGQVTLKHTRAKLFAYNSTVPLPLLGKFTATIATKKRYDAADFYVVKGSQSSGCLLGSISAVNLGILHIVNSVRTKSRFSSKGQVISSPGAVAEQTSTPSWQRKLSKLIHDNDDLFHGIGKLKGVKVKLHIDESVKPVAQRHRRVPFHLRDKVEAEVTRLERADVIEKVDSATEWVSPIVISPKKDSNKIRMCVDMVEPNRAIKRTRHVIPTVEELRHDLNGAKIFSKLDLANGFHQLELDEESRHITTFSTHIGLRRYCRLNFGTNSAPEIFHEALRKTLEGIPGVKNIHDDVLVFGFDEEDHYRALRATFQRLRDSGLTLKRSKCEFGKTSIQFFGLVFSDRGISPDPEKVAPLQHLSPPRNQAEVRSFLGMANYSAQFIYNYATLAAPLRELTRKNARWTWTARHEKSFKAIKESLRKTALLNYYDPNLRTEVVCDGSPVGIGAMLVQYDPTTQVPRVITYNSRSLTDVERRYGQIERESLAIQYGCLRNEIYLLGRDFNVVTDHKPLVSLYNNPRRPGPFRVERMRLKLQGFRFKVLYRPGKLNPADYASRHPLPLARCSKEELKASAELEAHVNWVVTTDVPSSLKLQEIRSATYCDPVLQALYDAIKNKQPLLDEKFKHFKSVADELSIAKGVILRGTKIIIPKSLQSKVVRIAHEGHQGLVKTKQFLRSRVWFPKMDEVVSSVVGPCVACQATVYTPSQEPIQSTQLPNGPWESLAVDYYGPLPSGDYVLVVIDEYSRFAEIDFTTSTSANATIPKLDRIFSSYGIPLQLKSDNGAPFNAKAFSDYCEFMGIQHNTITPLHPRANGLVENFNRMISKVVRTSSIERKCWKQELFKFLRNYRATPHITTGKGPADLLFQTRPYRVRLPELSQFQNDDSEIRTRDAKKKLQAKQYADRKSYVKKSIVKVGDVVRVRNEKKGKLEPVYDPGPYTVTQMKGTMVTATRTNPRHVVTRNTSYFKRLKVSNDEPAAYTEFTEVDEVDGDFDVFENSDLHPDHIVREDENNEDPQNEENWDEDLGNAEAEVAAEQGNDRDERRHVTEENTHEEELDIGEAGQAVVGRPRRQRRAPERYEQYEMGDDY